MCKIVCYCRVKPTKKFAFREGGVLYLWQKVVMSIRGSSYAERVKFQLDEWKRGNSIHNDVDDECCPDFSCCKPELLASKEKRETFCAVVEKGDEDTKMGMLMEFLGRGMAEIGKDVYISGNHFVEDN